MLIVWAGKKLKDNKLKLKFVKYNLLNKRANKLEPNLLHFLPVASKWSFFISSSFDVLIETPT